MIVGIAVLMVNQLKSGDYVYYIPVPIHSILIYNYGGVLVYSQTVSHAHSAHVLLKESEILISGGLSGFSMFFKEILGSNAKLSHIVASPYEFLFSELPGLSGTMVLITSGANYFLKKSLKNLQIY